MARPAWSSYEKIKSIGAGAGGQVFLARGIREHGGVDGIFCVKRVFLQDKDELLQQAANEIHLLRVLKHPNIVQHVDDFFDDEGYLNIVMEYCEHGDLARYILNHVNAGTKIPLKTVVYFAFQLITGIRYLHQCNVVHRDIKPSNIFLVDNGEGDGNFILKIADFGISRTLGPDSVAQTVVGTPHYLAPEICESAPYTNKADLWALGIVLYELATLKKPFDGSNLLAVVRKITSGKFEPIVDPEYEPIFPMIRHLLNINAEKRPSAYALEQMFYTSGLKVRPSSAAKSEAGGENKYDDEQFEEEDYNDDFESGA